MCECHPLTNMLQLTQNARGFLTDISYNPGKWCSARTNTSTSGTAQRAFKNFGPRFPSENLHLISYNECLFQKDYYDFLIILKKEMKIHINLLQTSSLLIFAIQSCSSFLPVNMENLFSFQWAPNRSSTLKYRRAMLFIHVVSHISVPFSHCKGEIS